MSGNKEVTGYPKVPVAIDKSLGEIDRKYWTGLATEGTLGSNRSSRCRREMTRIPKEGNLPNHFEPDVSGLLSTVPKKPAESVRELPEPLLDSDEAASIMKIHPKTLQKLARKGVVRGVHVGKLWRFRASEIEHWISSQMAS